MRNSPDQKPNEEATQGEGRNQDVAPVKSKLAWVWADVAQQSEGRPERAIHAQNRNHGKCADVDAILVAAQQPRQQDEVQPLTDDGETLAKEYP